jgi:hypothetical protein
MRMDIEISPGAPAQRSDAAARDNWGLACGDGGIAEKRLCSNGHFATVREERIRRFTEERARNVLWHHSSVNLVEPRPSHWPRRIFPGDCRGSTRVSIPESARQHSRGRIRQLSPQKRDFFGCAR